MRLKTGGAPREELTVWFEGRQLAALEGETIAATLFAHGETATCTAKDGAPRGVFCGMGFCHDCLVTVDGRASQRACMTKARGGMRIARADAGRVSLGEGSADLAELPGEALPEQAYDVVVVGGGPGGLKAAEAARSAGASVLIIDERPAPGGQFFKQPVSATMRGDAQARQGAALIERVKRLGASFAEETLVWGASRHTDGGIELATMSGGRAGLVRPRMLIVATGAYEHTLKVPGWTLPGVMTTGACQTLLRNYDVSPGRRVLIAGNGPLNLQVAAELVRAGAKVVAVAEAAPAPWTRPAAGLGMMAASPRLAATGMAALASLRWAGVPVLWGHVLRRVEGASRAERAVLASAIDAGGRVVAFAADAICMSYGFLPSNELPRLLGCWHFPNALPVPHLQVQRSENGATSLADVFVVGEAGGFGGAHIAMAQGELAGAEAARRLGFEMNVGPRSLAYRDLDHHRRFQAVLWRMFAATILDGPMGGDEESSLICRCEAVSLATLRKTVAEKGVRDIATLKRLTRAGMGRCQGRYCGPSLLSLVPEEPLTSEAAFLAPQAPLRPVPVAAVALEKPEWGGHKRALLPETKAAAGERLPISEADIVVIGAGIVGLSTALFLARAGREVVVLDRGKPNALASGGNAGSLHAQLLSFDHGARAEAGGGPAARTLRLQSESIDLWQRLERELNADFELKITGGLMVAENERDFAFLKAKTAVERAQGIPCDLIGAEDLRRLEPALGEGLIGAAYCPREGKINPLVATQHILDAALAAGMRLFPDTEVRTIHAQPSGYLIETQRGPVRTGRLVNAAGAFASRIGAMVGLNLPVHGAPLQMIVTEAVTPLVSCLVAHADRHLTLKQAANGNVIIGGGWTAGLDPVHNRPRPLRASIEGNLWVAQHVLPALRKLHVLRSWAAMNINIDGAPILGEAPGLRGFFNAVTSNGYTLGPIMGLITAELVASGRTERDIASFLMQRFDR
jgi:glycine/D-amino acid oxidase-like deaminating enzyme